VSGNGIKAMACTAIFGASTPKVSTGHATAAPTITEKSVCWRLLVAPKRAPTAQPRQNRRRITTPGS